jgi:hypothetical protein
VISDLMAKVLIFAPNIASFVMFLLPRRSKKSVGKGLKIFNNTASK